MLTALSKINYFSTARYFGSYDFSTLYTSISHQTLKNALQELITEAYEIKDSEFIVADSTGNAFLSDVSSRVTSKHTLSRETLVQHV